MSNAEDASPHFVRDWRHAKGLTLEFVADAIGMSHQNLGKIERYKVPLAGQHVGPLSRVLEIEPSEIFSPPKPIRPKTVPLVGYVGAGAEAHFYGATDVLGEVDAPPKVNDATRAAEIRGDSLGPLFESWLVFYDDVRTPVTPDLVGHLCIVGLPNDKVLVKKIQRSRTPGLFHLLSNTETPMFDQEVVWAARVTDMRPR